MCLFGAQERDRGLETEHSANIHEVLAIFLVWSLSLWCSQCACMHVCAHLLMGMLAWTTQYKIQWIMMSVVICEAQGATGGDLSLPRSLETLHKEV